MPNIETMERIIDLIPNEKAVLISSPHGYGKSEFVQAWCSRNNYGLIQLFLGAMADAGDLIGLPDRTEVILKFGGKEVKQKLTEFCPPKWFPFDPEAKIVLFLDEFNRGKEEVYQCIQDMVLNRQINGLHLPKNTRIFAAINPLSAEYGYQVKELDPALYDRFAVFVFEPSLREWVDWGITNKLNKHIIGFITQSGETHLDPPVSGKLGQVYPSRRSWKHLSDVLNEHPYLITDSKFLQTICMGYVGASATSSFISYIDQMSLGLNPGSVVTDWSSDLARKVKETNPQSIIEFNSRLALYLREEESNLFDCAGVQEKNKYSHNVYSYLKEVTSMSTELVADFFSHVTAAHLRGDTWATKLLDFEPLVIWFAEVTDGEENNPIDSNDHFGESNLDDILG